MPQIISSSVEDEVVILTRKAIVGIHYGQLVHRGQQLRVRLPLLGDGLGTLVNHARFTHGERNNGKVDEPGRVTRATRRATTGFLLATLIPLRTIEMSRKLDFGSQEVTAVINHYTLGIRPGRLLSTEVVQINAELQHFSDDFGELELREYRPPANSGREVFRPTHVNETHGALLARFVTLLDRLDALVREALHRHLIAPLGDCQGESAAWFDFVSHVSPKAIEARDSIRLDDGTILTYSSIPRVAGVSKKALNALWFAVRSERIGGH